MLDGKETLSLPGDLSSKLEALARESPEQYKLIHDLCSDELGQVHLFQQWIDAASISQKQVKELGDQLEKLNASYPGGLRSYILKAKALLKSESSLWNKIRSCLLFTS